MAKLVAATLYLVLVVLLHLYGQQCKAVAGGGTSSHGGGGRATSTAVRAMFVFGSSLVDNGNNNFLNGSGVRADYPPYGVDFPLGVTGRFSNGRNVIDALGELLRLPAAGLLPPFADPSTRGRAALHGVNFASGGSGILDITGQHTGGVLSLKQQITNFEAVTLPDLRAQLQGATAAHPTAGHKMKGQDFFDQCYLPKSLFVIGTGGNDYLLNYFNPRGGPTRPHLSEFTSSLLTKLSTHLQRLYDLGARKFVVLSIQPLGCTPVVRSFVNVTGEACIEPVNRAVLLFNSGLRSLVSRHGNGSMRSRMPGANFVYVNSYKIIGDMIHHPTKFGIRETSRACCEVSRGSSSRGGVLCQKGGPICSDRTRYAFFDGLHPTDVVNARLARRAYGSSSPGEAYPINVKQLSML
ncbi:GDSL esterase/lipase At1g71250-like [Oryza brachyantha]|uniref:GDSL esterase/lipase n=1 Tax=Oryza brachyantha TaxID=4533 RepID=J3MF17_ORYBR|nr:GDSL esterase/lipase At1g71250-like [Oryza brachyantha]